MRFRLGWVVAVVRLFLIALAFGTFAVSISLLKLQQRVHKLAFDVLVDVCLVCDESFYGSGYPFKYLVTQPQILMPLLQCFLDFLLHI